MNRIAFLCILLAAFQTFSPRARAEAPPAGPASLLEKPRPDQGYYYTLGLHGGVTHVRDDAHTLSPLGGYAAALRLGQSVTTWMDLGLWLDVGVMQDDERTGTQLSFGFDWTLHPLRGAFVRLGTAIGVSQLSAAENSDNRASAFGTVLGVTLGYASFPWASPGQSGGFAISPVLRVHAIQPFREDAVYWTMVGVEVTRWTGLPERQLDVPLSDAYARTR